MNEQNIPQSNEPVQSSQKYIWVTIIAIIVTAMIVGGGIYVWQKANLNSTQQTLQQQISVLQNQVDQLQGELAVQGQQNPQPEIDQDQDNNQQNDQSGNIENAHEALIEYFELLNTKQYSEAVSYHGSGYDYLHNWNPSTDENDFAGLLKNGCEMNGLQCLKVKSTVEQQKVSPVEFKFVVQFADKDGSLFKRGPCCGATEEEMPTKTNFEFVIKLVNDRYMVVSQPVYVP